MRAFTFICVIALSLSVYAKKTEAGLTIEGYGKKPQRNIATTTVNDMNTVISKLGKMGSASSSKTYTAETIGFGGSSGALKRPKPQKKSAVGLTADSNRTK